MWNGGGEGVEQARTLPIYAAREFEFCQRDVSPREARETCPLMSQARRSKSQFSAEFLTYYLLPDARWAQRASKFRSVLVKTNDDNAWEEIKKRDKNSNRLK